MDKIFDALANLINVNTLIVGILGGMILFFPEDIQMQIVAGLIGFLARDVIKYDK
jgi:hypothetical protein